MNKDDILMKYLNNELTKSEESELKSLLDSDSEFNSLFNKMNRIESELSKLKFNPADEDIAFLNQYSNRLINLKDTNKPFNLFNRLKSRKVIIPFLFVTLLIILATSYFFNINKDNNTDITISNQSTTNSNTHNNNKNLDTDDGNTSISDEFNDTALFVPENNVLNDVHTNNKQLHDDFTASQPSLQEQHSSKSDDAIIQGQIHDNNLLENKQLIHNLELQLDEYRKQGDVLNQQWTLKRLGIFYAQMDEYNKGIKYLDEALFLNASSIDKSLKAEILGEKAIIYFDLQQFDNAVKNKISCLELLESINSDRLDRWKNKLSMIK